ncbi:MAG: cytochrome c [Zoogloeaceae bacterium]|jgi:cytochrome c556|nr:cytochrome c [Zoogloeaceae bacterium]
MKLSFKKSLITLLCLGVSASAFAQSSQLTKPEQLIKVRQSLFQTIGWNCTRIRQNLDKEYNKTEVIKSAEVIATLANSALDVLFAPGTATGKGWKDTAVKPEFFSKPEHSAQLLHQFRKEANTLAELVQTGSAEIVRPQFENLVKTCKACHDDFRNN